MEHQDLQEHLHRSNADEETVDLLKQMSMAIYLSQFNIETVLFSNACLARSVPLK